MANSPLKEIFQDVTLIIDKATFTQTQGTDILSGLSVQKKGLSYEACGSYEEIENAVVKLSSLERSSPPNGKYERQTHHLSTQVEPVEVDEAIMIYIKQKCNKEFERIQGGDISVTLTRGHHKQLVAFQSLDQRNGSVHAQFARERFITFYQRIATELQVKSYSLDPAEIKHLKSEFPELLIDSNPAKQTVTGSFINMERFEEFLKSGPISPGQKLQTQRMQSVKTSSYSTVRDQQEDKEETCPICLETLTGSVKKTLPQCQHSFCKDCLKRAFEFKPACPICGILYGELKGTQPAGTMNVSTDWSPLPGYENYGTITIEYYIPSGTQGEQHPNPGQKYEGASRTAYLPDSTEGRRVLALLRRAFDQRLIFTIGQSSTSGRSNVVTWNDIHHKTSQTGGTTYYGYPDPHYLKRVQEELKVKGIQ